MEIIEKIKVIDSIYSIDSFNKLFLKCPELASKDHNYKYELLMLSKKYDQAYFFINSIDSNYFTQPFRPKELYLNLTKGLKFINLNKNKDRDSIFNIISNNYLKYIKNNLSDEVALYDYVKIMSSVEHKKITLERLDKIFTEEKYGNFDYLGFKESVIKNSYCDIGFYASIFLYNYKGF